MSPVETDQLDTLVRFSRRQLWWLLGFMVLLGGGFLVDLLVPHPTPVMVTMLIIVLVFAAFPSSKKIRWGSPATRRAMAALDSDELRQLAQAKAFRNGFLVQMLYPVPCGYALMSFGVANPWPFALGSSAWLGFVTFLGSMLWYDR